MPCFMREKSLSFRPRRDKVNDRDAMAPKPVRPRAIRYHGLFGMSIASQHLIVDEKWTPDSLVEQYSGFTDLLSRRVIYKRHETKANRRLLLKQSKRLKMQCSDGRIKLQKISSGNNSHTIRNFLINHRDMQRLYQRMPIYQVVDNINQRTFILRKERDRLEFRLNQRKHEYRELLLDRAEVENRIKYANEFQREEELKSRVLLKKIENSNVRLKAITTINTTYKKIIQVLLQDEIFYEPILRSLDDDMEDQANFIKNILYMGLPAIAKFKELNIEYRQLEYKSRKNLQSKMQMLSSLLKRHTPSVPVHKAKEELTASADPRRYVRETKSMTVLKVELQSIEKTIKELKLVTLCSQAREIFPNVRTQMENNKKLDRLIQLKFLKRSDLETKMKCTSMLQNVLVNNLSEEEINRLERISDLKKILEADEKFEKETLEHIRNRAGAYVTFRLCLWNLVEILRHVDRQPRTFRTQYPNSYLKLPLLKFEMLDIIAAPPELYEEDLEKVMLLLKRKLYKLMKAYKPDMNSSIAQSKDKYHNLFLVSHKGRSADDNDRMSMVAEDDLLQSNKMTNVPNRKQIKALSARLMEVAAKRDEAN
ncbi:ankyrin repeat domain-containing protein 26-like [Drosophila innubila]|uniref:ankyrin repeat domain-containing protein 26-like n=1 Tax=Drosophila innubila TaxID=198719 RepID=UPI00148D343C|nr:ankyrin repeat domain-containing protein 26-like [Drosophila innubila]